jgi:hypothetical protein
MMVYKIRGFHRGEALYILVLLVYDNEQSVTSSRRWRQCVLLTVYIYIPYYMKS